MADLSVAVSIAGKDELSGPAGAAEKALRALGGQGSSTAQDLAGLDGQVEKSKGALSGLGGAAATAGKAVAIGLAAAGAAVAGIGVAAAKTAGDVQQSVANISTIKPDIDTSAVFNSLNEISTRVPQSAKQLGDSLYDIFSSVDVSQQQALSLVETFAKGAVGAQTDAQTFGTSIMGVMNAYGLSVEDATHISDVFFNTVNAGVVTGQELASSLGPVTQAAKAAGVSIDELGGFIAGVTKEGGPAAQNINNLNNFFEKLTTKEAQAQLHDLGIATTDATGKFLPVEDVLTKLRDKLGGYTESARAAALQAIFPDAQARQGAATLISQLDFVKDAINNNVTDAGSAASAYEKMAATFNSQTALLQNTFTSILATIGANLLPSITPIITAFAKGLPDAFTTASVQLGVLGGNVQTIASGALAGLQGMLENVGVGLAGWAAQAGSAGQLVSSALSGATGIVQALAFAIQGNLPAAAEAAGGAFDALSGAVNLVRDPIGLLQGAWQGLQGAMTAFAPTGERLSTVFGAIRSAIAAVVPSPLVDFAQGLAGAVGAANEEESAVTRVADAVNAVSGSFGAATQFVSEHKEVQAALSVVLGGATAAVALWAATAGTAALASGAMSVALGIQAAATGVATAAQIALDVALDANPIGLIVIAIGALVGGIIWAYNNVGWFHDAVDNAFTVAKQVVQAFGDIAVPLLQRFGQWLQEVWQQAQELMPQIGDFFDHLGTTIHDTMDAIGSTIQSVWETITSTWNAAQTAIQDAVSSVWNAIPEDIRSDLELIVSTLADRFGAALQAAQQWLSDTSSAISAGWTSISSDLSGTLSAIGEAISGAWNDAVSATTTFLTGISTAISTTWTTIQADATTAWNAVKDAIGTPLQAALTFVTGFASDVVNAIHGMIASTGSEASGVGSAIVEGIKAAIQRGAGAIGEAAASAARAALAAAKDALGIHSPSTEFLQVGLDSMAGFVLGVNQAAPAVATAVHSAAQTALASAAPSSATPTPDQMRAYLTQAALDRGIDPSVATRVFGAESVGFTQFEGDRGSVSGRPTSFGPAQLHVGGLDPGGIQNGGGLGDTFIRQTGLDPADIRTWQQQLDFALNQVVTSGWGAWHAAAAVGVSNWQGIARDAGQKAVSAYSDGVASGQTAVTASVGSLNADVTGGLQAATSSITATLAVTNQQVEDFTAQWGVNWDESRSALDLAAQAIQANLDAGGTGSVSDSLGGLMTHAGEFADQWGITWEQATTILGKAVYAAHDDLANQIPSAIAATTGSLNDGLDPAIAKAIGDKGTGLLGITAAGDGMLASFVQAAKGADLLTAALKSVPSSIDSTVNVHLNTIGGGSVSLGRSGGGSGGSSGAGNGQSSGSGYQYGSSTAFLAPFGGYTDKNDVSVLDVLNGVNQYDENGNPRQITGLPPGQSLGDVIQGIQNQTESGQANNQINGSAYYDGPDPSNNYGYGYANGGLLTRPSYLVDMATGQISGTIVEDGPEWVIPAKGGGVNAGIPGARPTWGEGGIDYDQLAAALARQPIILQVDGRVLGQVARTDNRRDARANLPNGVGALVPS